MNAATITTRELPHSSEAKGHAPEWCALVRQYLAGDVSAGHPAFASVARWQAQNATERKEDARHG